MHVRALQHWLRSTWWGQILAEHDTEPTELAGGLLKVGIGLWLLLPFNTLASSPTFRAMSAIPEPVWGIFLFSVGVIHLGALRVGNVRARRISAVIGFLVWFSLGSTFVFSNPPAVGFIMFLLTAIGQGWAYVRLTLVHRVLP